jgi:uncharacterized membrane protein (Fun14 family)
MFCFYSKVYFEARIICPSLQFLKAFLQCVCVAVAFFTCLSRVTDFKHHASDVIGGAIIGFCIAVFTVRQFKSIRYFIIFFLFLRLYVLEHIYGQLISIAKQRKKQKKIVHQQANALLYLLLKQNHQVHYVPMNRHMMKVHQLQHVHVMVIDQIMIMLHQCNPNNNNNIELFLILPKQLVDNVHLLEDYLEKLMFESDFRIYIQSHLLFLLRS